MCGPDSIHNEATTLKNCFFVITITKIKQFFMGALVGALFVRNTNKTNNKQHVNRGFDSESGTTFPFYTSLSIPARSKFNELT